MLGVEAQDLGIADLVHRLLAGHFNVAQQELDKDILGKVLVTVSALCLITVAWLLIWGYFLD